MLIPVELLDVIVSVFVELADPAIDVLGDTVTTGFLDGLSDRLFKKFVLV